MSSLSSNYSPPVSGTQPLSLLNYIAISGSLVLFLLLIFCLVRCFRSTRPYFISPSFVKEYARSHFEKEHSQQQEDCEVSRFGFHDRSISNLQLSQKDFNLAPKKLTFKKALGIATRDILFNCQRKTHTPHIPCGLKLLVFFFSSLVGLGSIMMVYPLLIPCSLRVSTLNTKLIYPENSGAGCLEESRNFMLSYFQLGLAALASGVLCCLMSGLAFLCLNRALRLRIKLILEAKKEASPNKSMELATPQLHHSPSPRKSVMSNSSQKYQSEELKESENNQTPSQRMSLLQVPPKSPLNIPSEQWNGNTDQQFLNTQFLRSRINATYSLCFYLLIALLGLGSVGAILAASYTLMAAYLQFCLLAGLASGLVNCVCLTPVFASFFHSCVIHRAECRVQEYSHSGLTKATQCLEKMERQQEWLRLWKFKEKQTRPIPADDAPLFQGLLTANDGDFYPRTSPLMDKHKKRMRGLSRSLNSSPFTQIQQKVKGSDFTFNIIPMAPLGEEQEQDGGVVMLLNSIDSEGDRDSQDPMSRMDSEKSLPYFKCEASNEQEYTRDTAGIKAMDETRESEPKIESQTRDGGELEYSRDQSIESGLISPVTPAHKYSDEKKGLSTIKQEPPTEQRCHSELTTQQKVEGSAELLTARVSQNEQQLERNLLQEIKDIPTSPQKERRNAKDDFPTPKPYSHIVHNVLKLEEEEDVFRLQEPFAESPDMLGVEAAFIPSRGYEEEIQLTPSKASMQGESLHFSTIDQDHDGRSTVVSNETNHIFKKRTPLANIQNIPQSAFRGVRQSNRSVSAQPVQKQPPSTADLVYSYSNTSSLHNPYKDNFKLNSCRSNSETSSFMPSQRARPKRSGKSSDSHMSVFREVGNEIVNHSLRSNESENQRFFSNLAGQHLEIRDEFEVTQKSARSARAQGSDGKLELLHRLGLSQEKVERQFIDREAEETHKLLTIQEQRRLLKKLLSLSREQHRVNDESKIQEMLDFLQISKRPLPASEVKFLHTLEMVSSPYDEELTRMIKTQRGIYRSGMKGSGEKDKAEIKRQRELRKRLTEEKIHKISGVYGSNMKRASSHKLSAKKVLALNLSKEKDPHRQA